MSSCSETARISERLEWWAVDLERSYLVKRVTILNRGDCCGKYIFIKVIVDVYYSDHEIV